MSRSDDSFDKPIAITGKLVEDRNGEVRIKIQERPFVKGTLNQLMNDSVCGWIIEPVDRLPLFAWSFRGLPLAKPYVVFRPKVLEATWYSVELQRRWQSKTYPNTNTFFYVPQTVDSIQLNPSFKSLLKYARRLSGIT
jgi:hypothetical protein